jgi:PIN domain nuclease of toxin-antitoxin system
VGGDAEVILLDTHVLAWLTTDSRKLSRHASSAIRRASRAGGVGISAITLWELSWLVANARIMTRGTAEAYLEEVSAMVAVRPITAKIAALATQFPANYSSDPCDRLIGATALAEGIVLVTKDERIRSFPGLQTLW